MWDDGTAWWHKYYPPYERREIQAFADNMIKRMLTEPGCQSVRKHAHVAPLLFRPVGID